MRDITLIHETVQKHYGMLAEEESPDCGPTTCCGEDTADNAMLIYQPELLDGLPFDVTGLSLGCGDPVTIAGLRPGEHVLDLGSGGGIDCFLAARQVGASGYVIGVDMTPAMVARANVNKQWLQADNVEFRQGQIEALPVADSSIDVVMSNCVVNLAPDKLAVFVEAYRVLKPGGRISLSDIVTEGDFSPAQSADLEQWAKCITGAIDVGRYLGLMQEAGFVDVHITDKEPAIEAVSRLAGMPRVFSARITARKPNELV